MHEVRFAWVHGHRRAFLDVGEGPAVLLIHGIGDTGDTWSEVVDRLARDHRVIVPDLLGHGQSAKPRADYSPAAYANGMRDLLLLLGIESATIVGHSLGGGIAMQLAYQHPSLCERLVLVSPGGVSHDVVALLRWVSTPAAYLLLPLLQGRVSRRLAGWVARALERFGTALGSDGREFLRAYENLPDARSRAVFLRALRSVVDRRGQTVTMLDRCYLAADVPTLLVWGARDPVIPRHHAEVAHRAIPGSRMVVLPDAGHFPHRTCPERFLEVVAAFLAETEPARHEPQAWRDRLRRSTATTLAAGEASSRAIEAAPDVPRAPLRLAAQHP